MDLARIRTYVVVITALFAVALIRIVINSNPLYSFFEPVLSKVSEVSSGFTVHRQSSDTIDSSELQIELLRTENENLRSLANLTNDTNTVNTEVIRRNMLGFEKNVWVNRGTSSGLAVGQTVLYEGELFGVVQRVFEDTAEIQTILDPQFRSTVSIGDEQGIVAIEHGSIMVELVPDKSLQGSLVQTNGLDGLLMAGVPAGRLGVLASSEDEVFASYALQLSFSPYSVNYLQIIVGEESSAL